MSVAKRYSKTNRPKQVKEKPGKISMVETAGYRNTKTQIEEYMDAGRRLGEYRRLKYDFEPGVKVDEDFEDRTRRPGYDPADATQDLRRAEASLKESARIKKEAKEAADKADLAMVSNNEKEKVEE